MVAERKRLKGSQRGKKKNSKTSFARESVIAKVASFLKKDRRQVRYILKVSKDKPVGNVFYTVSSSIDPITFTNEKHAEQLKRLLRKSIHPIEADIIRREVMDDGYELTYESESAK